MNIYSNLPTFQLRTKKWHDFVSWTLKIWRTGIRLNDILDSIPFEDEVAPQMFLLLYIVMRSGLSNLNLWRTACSIMNITKVECSGVFDIKRRPPAGTDENGNLVFSITP